MNKSILPTTWRLCCLGTCLLMGTIRCTSDIPYPQTHTVDHVDQYHGIAVRDPYRWLEKDVRESKEVKDWVQAQNEVTNRYLNTLPNRESIKQRLTALWNYEKYSVPMKRGDRYYFSRNDGLQNHAVEYWRETAQGTAEVLFDPNQWSDDGTVALSGMSFSPDERYVAYGIQESGSDWRTWKVRDLKTGADLADQLRYLKSTDVEWDPHSRGLFYAKYPDPSEKDQYQSLNREMKVRYHELGTDQSEDGVVYYRPDHPEWGYGLDVTDDGHYLILTVWVGTDNKYRLLYKDLRQPYSMPVDLISSFENDYSFIDNDGSVFYFKTDLDAPKGRVIAIDLEQPEPSRWKEIIPEADHPLISVSLVHNQFIAHYLEDVASKVRCHDLNGMLLREIDLPGVGTAAGFSGRREDTVTFFSFESYHIPTSIYWHDLMTHRTEILEQPTLDFQPDQYESRRVFYASKDGTQIPLFLTHRKGLKMDGTNPTLLYGYGGFNISIRPRFSVATAAWIERGGVYAVANIRGGGEYGKTWHDAGKKLNKQNVFDDFIAAAEFLIQQGVTRPDKLAIEGRSNGGLLIGACINQRPDLFGAAIPGVGVMDMLRFEAFTAGRFWTDDYGSAQDDIEMFRYLWGYSPYHNIRPDAAYPATLITTADTDDRVVPGHSFKFAAQLQASHSGPDPVLIRIETRAGHGSGKPTSMQIEERADIMAFLFSNLNVP